MFNNLGILAESVHLAAAMLISGMVLLLDRADLLQHDTNRTQRPFTVGQTITFSHYIQNIFS